MEYFVAGTRTATRDAVYRESLAEHRGCEDATHFVHAYNLGAFALGSASELEVSAGGSAYGFGVEGGHSRGQNAEKKGGQLADCRADDATEIEGCKAPIRLTLREIRDGEDPDLAARSAPTTDASLNAVGKLATKLDDNDEAAARFAAANRALRARDGKQCVAQLNHYDRLVPQQASTKDDSPLALTRAYCLMLAGKCRAGQKRIRKLQGALGFRGMSPEDTETWVERESAKYCVGKVEPRIDILRSLEALREGGAVDTGVEHCSKHYKTIQRLRGQVKSKGPGDYVFNDLDLQLLVTAPACFGRAGDCRQAWGIYRKYKMVEALPGAPVTAQELEAGFESAAPTCRP
jgi:hypothetical protein